MRFKLSLLSAVAAVSLCQFLVTEVHSKGICDGLGVCHKSQGPSAADQLEGWAKAHINQGPATATNQEGIPMPSLTASQAIGSQGHILLQDSFLLEKTAAFNRERMPERVVHAKGAGAFGTFQVLSDVKQYTKAKFLDTVGKVTEVVVRFSTVGGELGSGDTWIDPKGFATKFYTEEGIYDLVGNNLEIFPIRDPMLFTDLNRSRKRNPATHLRDPNMWWDFTSLRPETTLHTLHLFSDEGTPDGLRRMNGSGVHTYKWVNAQNNAVYIKYHWVSNQEKKVMTRQEALLLAGTNPDYSIQDLYDAIARAEYPSWDMYIQVMTFAQAAAHPQNPFDITKHWRREEYPLIGPVGKMTLNRNPTDYFTQVESAAFSPANIVPGIEPSPDRMLHARMFSYQDAQRYRIGPNFAQLPVNKAKSRIENYFRDGAMCHDQNGQGSPNYFPNSYGGLNDAAAAQTVFPVSGDVDRTETKDDDNFSLAKLYLDNDIDAAEKQRLVDNLAAVLVNADAAVQTRFLDNNCLPISAAFRAQVATALANAKVNLNKV